MANRTHSETSSSKRVNEWMRGKVQTPFLPSSSSPPMPATTTNQPKKKKTPRIFSYESQFTLLYNRSLRDENGIHNYNMLVFQWDTRANTYTFPGIRVGNVKTHTSRERRKKNVFPSVIYDDKRKYSFGCAFFSPKAIWFVALYV